ALPAPVGRGEQRRLDACEVDHAAAVVIIDQSPAQRLARRIGGVLRELRGRERLRSRDRLAGDDAARTALADAVLHAQDLALVPVIDEAAEDAAVARELAVLIRKSFPDAQRGEMRRPQRADLPLVGGEVGNAVQSDLAIAPGLSGSPLDAVVEVACLARRPDVDDARRAAGAARIDAHADVAIGHPLLRIDQLPALVLVARAIEHL